MKHFIALAALLGIIAVSCASRQTVARGGAESLRQFEPLVEVEAVKRAPRPLGKTPPASPTEPQGKENPDPSAEPAQKHDAAPDDGQLPLFLQHDKFHTLAI